MTLCPFSFYSMKFILMVMTIRVLVVMMLWLDFKSSWHCIRAHYIGEVHNHGNDDQSTCGNDALAGLKVIITLYPFSLYSMKLILMVMTIRVLVVMMLWLDYTSSWTDSHPTFARWPTFRLLLHRYRINRHNDSLGFSLLFTIYLFLFYFFSNFQSLYEEEKINLYLGLSVTLWRRKNINLICYFNMGAVHILRNTNGSRETPSPPMYVIS